MPRLHYELMKGDLIIPYLHITIDEFLVARWEQEHHHIYREFISHQAIQVIGETPMDPMHVNQVTHQASVLLHLG
jgi:hypothetical protein